MKHHAEVFMITERGTLQRWVQRLAREVLEAGKVESRDGRNSKMGWRSSAMKPSVLGVLCKLMD